MKRKPTQKLLRTMKSVTFGFLCLFSSNMRGRLCPPAGLGDSWDSGLRVPLDKLEEVSRAKELFSETAGPGI